MTDGTNGGGIAAQHAPPRPIRVFAAPTDEARHNAIRPLLLPIACWRLDDARFEFDSSFVKPAARLEFSRLAELIEKNPGAPLSIFGHADPTGQEDYNKKLSGRRARAIHAVLIRNPDEWEKLSSEPHGEDDWKKKKVTSAMLVALGRGDDTDSIKGFQAENGLKDDGVVGKDTRQALYLAYMKLLCSEEVPPGAGSEGDFQTLAPLGDDAFLARGAGKDRKGDVQGCGEFNPILLFSEEEQKEFKKPANFPERNAENEPNRRVVIYLFPAGTQVDPASWPCPTALEGPAGCRKRLWSDSKERLRAGEGSNRRRYEETHDTFACRFYDRFARRSPCEAGRGAAPPLVHLSLVLHLTSSAGPLKNEKYKLFLPNDVVVEDATDDDGLLNRPDVPPGDYALEIAGRSTFVSAIPLDENRLPWIVDESASEEA